MQHGGGGRGGKVDVWELAKPSAIVVITVLVAIRLLYLRILVTIARRSRSDRDLDFFKK